MSFSRMHRRGLGDEEALHPEPDRVVIDRVDANVKALVSTMQDDAKRRKISLAIGIVGVVFAAAKLGIIAIPHIKKWRDS